MKLYQYTILRDDGTKEVLLPTKKKEFNGPEGLYELLGCNMIEIIPSDYYEGLGWGRCTVYGDEEGRFKKDNQRNPHFKVLGSGMFGNGWDVVGTCIKEEVYKEAK